MSMGTIVVASALIVAVAAIIVHMVKLARSGKHIGCEGCSSADTSGCDGQCIHCGTCCSAEKMVDDIESCLDPTDAGLYETGTSDAR